MSVVRLGLKLAPVEIGGCPYVVCKGNKSMLLIGGLLRSAPSMVFWKQNRVVPHVTPFEGFGRDLFSNIAVATLL